MKQGGIDLVAHAVGMARRAATSAPSVRLRLGCAETFISGPRSVILAFTGAVREMCTLVEEVVDTRTSTDAVLENFMRLAVLANFVPEWLMPQLHFEAEANLLAEEISVFADQIVESIRVFAEVELERRRATLH